MNRSRRTAAFAAACLTISLALTALAQPPDATPAPLPAPENTLPLRGVVASSSGAQDAGPPTVESPIPFHPANAVDSLPQTCWAPALLENVVGNGVEETLDLLLARPATVTALTILNGDCASEAAFEASSRPSSLRVLFQYEGSDAFADEINLTLTDGFTDPQTLSLGDHANVTAVRIMITGVFAGDTNKGVPCIAEISVQGAMP